MRKLANPRKAAERDLTFSEQLWRCFLLPHLQKVVSATIPWGEVCFPQYESKALEALEVDFQGTIIQMRMRR